MIDEILEPCKSCPHRSNIGRYYVCGCQCGQATKNGNHPLSPCHCDNGYCRISFEEYGGSLFCEEDEEAIAEGGRCYDYIAWLHAMDKFNGPGFKYPQKFKDRIIEFDD